MSVNGIKIEGSPSIVGLFYLYAKLELVRFFHYRRSSFLFSRQNPEYIFNNQHEDEIWSD